MNEFLEEVKKNIHLRTAHSELIGFWTVEFGGRMNKVFHIWKYGMIFPAEVFSIDFHSVKCCMTWNLLSL